MSVDIFFFWSSGKGSKLLLSKFKTCEQEFVTPTGKVSSVQQDSQSLLLAFISCFDRFYRPLGVVEVDI